MPPKKIVIIGAGASGVFTAYLLEKHAPGEFAITLLEKNERVGGHAQSVVEDADGDPVSIDYGAQFFSRTAQPEYCQMLEVEGLLQEPGLFKEAAAGVSIWDETEQVLRFRIPDSLGGILADVIKSADAVEQWLRFLEMTLHAKLLYEFGDWTTTFGDWIDGLDFVVGTDAEVEDFKANVMRPLMYQFGLVNPPDLDALSARFVVYYFLGSLPSGFAAAPFTVFNCLKGLDGIHDRLLSDYGLSGSVELGKTVASLEENGDGWTVTTTDASIYEADEVVFSTNPMQILAMLPDAAAYADVRSVLDDLEFVGVRVRIQNPAPHYMPANPADWSVSNVTVRDDEPAIDGPSNYMLSVWFGPMRDEESGAFFFKSWGSPDLVPIVADTHFEHWHQLMVGNPLFMARRQELREVHQGVHALWYVGGYTLEYDSQNSALRSANLAVLQILEKYGIPPAFPEYLLRGPEIAAARLGQLLKPVDPELPASFPLLDAIEEAIVTAMPDHPAVRLWQNRPGAR
jgi:hypothetical protein